MTVRNEKNPGLQDLTFYCGLKQTFLSQHLDFQKLRCILKGQVELVERIKQCPRAKWFLKSGPDREIEAGRQNLRPG